MTPFFSPIFRSSGTCKKFSDASTTADDDVVCIRLCDLHFKSLDNCFDVLGKYKQFPFIFKTPDLINVERFFNNYQKE